MIIPALWLSSMLDDWERVWGNSGQCTPVFKFGIVCDMNVCARAG